MVKCEKCSCEIDVDDNFCHNCGNITITGYSNLKSDNNLYLEQIKNDRLAILFFLMACFLIMFLIFTSISGKSLLKPFAYLKKQIFALKYGYNITLISNDNQYNNILINNIDDAKNIIIQDYERQSWQCQNNLDVSYIERGLEKNYSIINVNLCDMSLENARKIENTVSKIFAIFPNAIGYLTNISINNSSNLDDYIAYFQPIYQFVNNDSGGKKVNKTQILLNSYFYLDSSKTFNINNYVKGASLDTILSHELGHYIFFVSLLKQYDISILIVDDKNQNEFDEILNLLNSGVYAQKLVSEALINYNKKNQNVDMYEFTSSISKYATIENDDGIIFEETIAEAVHDYYINGENATDSSLEIIKVLKERLK